MDALKKYGKFPVPTWSDREGEAPEISCRSRSRTDELSMANTTNVLSVKTSWHQKGVDRIAGRDGHLGSKLDNDSSCIKRLRLSAC